MAVLAATLNTVASQLLAAPANPLSPIRYVRIENNSPSASIAVSFGLQEPALNTAGSFSIAPGQYMDWRGPGFMNNLAINGIAGATNTPVTIQYY